MEFARVLLKTKKDQSLRRKHPWVFSGAIKKIFKGDTKNYQPKDGEIVEVYSNKEKYLATGHYQNSSLTIRAFSFKKNNPDANYWKARIKQAWEFRKQLGLTENPTTNAFRLINAEGDGMPGLIMDYYNGVVVLQAYSIGMHQLRTEILEALKSNLGDHLKAVYDKSSSTLPKEYAKNIEDKYLFSKEVVEKTIIENNCKFHIDWETGQKTGFFLDQRDNRKLLSQYSMGKMVLNTFCYTGGFSVYAALGGAQKVHSVDSSAKAMELTDQNISANGITHELHNSYKADVMEFMKDINQRYDVIVLDPPAFAKHRSARHKAVQGYKRLNAQAIRQIRSGGIIFTFSCSQVVDRKLFYDTITAAAIEAEREIKVLHHLSQPADHPVNIAHTEGEYLKGLVLHVQ